MQTALYILILALGSASYAVGVRQMLQGKYAPSVFSRVVWLLLAVNSFAGVVLSRGSKASVLLALILLIGNAAICLTSFWKGTRSFGKLEWFCLALLTISGMVWLFFHVPLINLGLSLLAHFIGAAPTYKRVWRNPASESTAFWSLFFGASVLSIFASSGHALSAVVFPIYFTLFDGSMFFLSARSLKKH